MIKVFCGIKLKTMSALGNWRQAQNESLAISLWAKTVQLISWPPAQQWNTGGGKENTKNRKTLEKSWTLSSGQYPPTSLITKKSKLCVDHQKEMSTEIKTNCDKHRLWHHCSRGKKQLKRCFGLAVHFGILDYLFLPVCAGNISTSDLLPIVLHFLNGKDLFQKRYNHQKEILA